MKHLRQMLSQKAFLFVATALAILTAFFSGRYLLDYLEDAAADRIYDERIAIIDSHAPAQLDDAYAHLDTQMKFVRDNTSHNMNEEFYTLWPDRMKLANTVIDYLEYRRDQKPPMECSTRSNILAALLRRDGFSVRNAVLYSPSNRLANHRIIEVKHPKDGSWDAYDITYDLYWRHRVTGERAGLLEVGAAPQSHEPCSAYGCGWHLETKDNMKAANLQDYLKIIMIDDEDGGERIARHHPDIDPGTVYNTADKGTGTFCELWRKNCSDGFSAFE